MPSELILYTNDKQWRVDLGSWTSDFPFYKSIGTQVTVYHREETSIWGSTVTDWVEEPALLIGIRNVYSGAGPAVATREREWRNTTEAELKEWSTGGSIRLPADNIASAEGTAVLDVNKVEGAVTIVIRDETLVGVVSASSVASEPAMPKDA
ncbi:MAG TPA: hypothetical protein VE398_03485 [Acidobacteriota bacterium]|nr:hypothetical protein [Acidobacteriota bacterium]